MQIFEDLYKYSSNEHSVSLKVGRKGENDRQNRRESTRDRNGYLEGQKNI